MKNTHLDHDHSPSSVIFFFSVIFVFLILAQPVDAASQTDPHLLCCMCGNDAHPASESGCANPDHPRNFSVPVLPHLPEEQRAAHKYFLHLASSKTIFDPNPAINGNRPYKGNFEDLIETGRIAESRISYSSSNPTKEESAPEVNLNAGENNLQPPTIAALLNLSIRGCFSSIDVIGAEAPEEFLAYDVAAIFKLPWGLYSQSGWGAGIRLMTSVGALTGAGDIGLVVSLLPLLALGSRDGRFTLDMGAGGAVFSRRTFGTQDFGGYFQFTLTAGLSIPIYKRLGVGYRFMHYSDSALYGHHTTGADMHMMELIYRF